VAQPSGFNAYPSYPGFYPSGPDGFLDTVTGSRTGLPEHVREERDEPTSSRTGSPGATADVITDIQDTVGASRTGNVVELGAGFGVTVVDTPLHPTIPSAGTLPQSGLLPRYTQQAQQGTTGAPVDTWVVDRGDTLTGNRTGAPVETSYGAGVGVADTPTGSRTGEPPVDSLIDRLPPDVADGSRSRTTSEVIDRGVGHVTGASRTGSPDEQALADRVVPDDVTASSTGLPPAGASVEWVDSVSALSWTGLPDDGARPVWHIWPDVPESNRTGLPTTIYEVVLTDRAGPGESLTGLTTGEQSAPLYPEADPREVTIFTYNYPDDDLYPQFHPGLTVPFGRLIPAAVDPHAATALALRYRLYLADTITGRIAYELPYAQLTWASKLNNIGTLSASVVVAHVYDALNDQDERDPRNLFRQFLSNGALRYSLVLTYGNTVVWAGPYTPTSVPGGAPIITLGGSDFGALLQRRLLVGPNPPSVESDVTIGPFSKPYLALELVRQATNPGGGGGGPWSLPWTCSDLPERAGTESRTYPGYDLWTVWDALSLLSQERDGPDFRFDPSLRQGDDGNYLSWNMVIGRPILATPHEWGWDAPATATVAWETNVSNFATHYYGAGSGQDRGKLMASASSDELLESGFPVIQITDTMHTSVIVQEELQALIDGDLATYSKPSNRWTLTVQASQVPLLGSYRAGDTVMIRVEQHPVIPDGVYHRRITSMNGDADDLVTITSSDSLVVQTTTSQGVQIITSD
jgi:hypothetical protein